MLENREILDFFKGEILIRKSWTAFMTFWTIIMWMLRTEEEDDIDPELFLDEDSEEEEEAEL